MSLKDTALGGVFGLAQTGIQQLLNKSADKRAQKYALEKMQKQYELNEMAADNAFNRSVEMFNMNNAYNDPAAARKRIEDAGGNYALAVGSGGTMAGASMMPTSAPMGGTSSASGQGSPAHFYDPISAAAAMASIDKTKAETEEIRGRTIDPGLLSEKIKSETGLSVSQADLNEFDLALRTDMREITIATARSKEKEIIANTVAALASADQSLASAEELRSRIAVNSAQCIVLKAEAALNKARISLTAAEQEMVRERALLYASERAKTNKHIDLLEKDLKNYDEKFTNEQERNKAEAKESQARSKYFNNRAKMYVAESITGIASTSASTMKTILGGFVSSDKIATIAKFL